MTAPHHPELRPTRRGLVRAAGGFAAAGAALGGSLAEATEEAKTSAEPRPAEPFCGPHQGGITTPIQNHTYFAAFDLETARRDEVINMLRAWTEAAAQMSEGKPAAAAVGSKDGFSACDSGETLGLPVARLTVTFGFGSELFSKNGKDRFGLSARRPPVLADLPAFNGDQLIESRTGGDLSVQACADDPQVAFHAVRQLARLAHGAAKIRWAQAGYVSRPDAEATPRNLLGFKDGTGNLSVRDPAAMAKFVWVGDEGPDWMTGGSYVVARRIRVALERWDRMTLAFQEQTLGRHKYSGAPLGANGEYDPPDLNGALKDSDPVIPASAHIRLAAAASNGGARILRRPYSYNDGVDFTTERWPPWREGIEYDAGLFFVCYQRDPREGFIRIFDNLSKFDLLNQFTTHTGGGLFACPGGIAKGEFIGQRLFEAG